MKKRICCFLLVFCFVAALLPTAAGAANILYSGTCGKNATWVITDDGVMTISGTGTVTELLPYEGANERNQLVKTIVIEEGITAISDYALVRYAELEYVEEALYLPDSLESIGTYAFAGHHELREIHFGKGLKSIGGNAFMEAEKLEHVTLPASLQKLYGGAFISCSSLKEITIPGSVKEVMESTFYDCTSLKKVTLGEGIVSIGTGAFDGCTSLEEMNFPASLRELGHNAFQRCDALVSVELPSIETIPGSLFNSCKNLEEVYLADGTKFIEEYAFYNCPKLQFVYIPDSVIEIGTRALASCPALESVRLPAKLTKIPAGLFEYDYALSEVIMPGTIRTIDQNAFCSCSPDLAIGFAGTEAQLNAVEVHPSGNEPLLQAPIYLLPAMPDPMFGFFDLPARDNWAYPGIAFCLMTGLMNGVGNGYFQPGGTTTRAQLVTILWRMMGEPEAKQPAPFTDLTQDWYREAVAWAAENNITNGTSPTTFSPNTPITREQMVTIFYRMCRDYLEMDVSPTASLAGFPDRSAVSAWAKDAMQWAVAVKLINGVGDGRGNSYLQPKGSATRAQIATVMLNFVNAFADEANFEAEAYSFTA